MTKDARTALWLIEGFYGPAWPDAARLANYRLLGRWGYTGAIYAPKADKSLRSDWRRPFLLKERERLAQMARTASQSGLIFGVGLSPMNVWNEWSGEARDHLAAKLKDIHACGCELLSLQFDDMHGAVPSLAMLQAEIITFACENWAGSHVIVCPTYYSDDPVLAKVFGDPPAHYLENLAKALPAHVDIFWTGPKVVSTAIEEDHILEVTARIGRRPFLWDNYPVNDGARTSRHLFLRAPQGRALLMNGQLAGYAANPMLQPRLSQIPLRALSLFAKGRAADSPDRLLSDAVRDCVEPSCVDLFLRYADTFAGQGLDGLSPHQVAEIAEAFRIENSPHTMEVTQWLAGEYAFDPACLTD